MRERTPFVRDHEWPQVVFILLVTILPFAIATCSRMHRDTRIQPEDCEPLDSDHFEYGAR